MNASQMTAKDRLKQLLENRVEIYIGGQEYPYRELRKPILVAIYADGSQETSNLLGHRNDDPLSRYPLKIKKYYHDYEIMLRILEKEGVDLEQFKTLGNKKIYARDINVDIRTLTTVDGAVYQFLLPYYQEYLTQPFRAS